MYKFEIYRNPEPPQSVNGYDAVRYNEDGYLFEREINPTWNDLAVKWDKEDGRAFYRKKLGGSFTLTGADYTWANDIRLDANERNNKYRSIIIKEKVDGVFQQLWRGFFSIIAGEWDVGNCSVTFTELVIWDEYTVYLENMENEKNMLDLPPFTVNINASAYPYETTFIRTAFAAYNPSAPCDWTLPPLNSNDVFYDDPSTTEDDKWMLYDRRIALNTENSFFETVSEYRRDYIIQVTDPGTGWVDIGDEPEGADTHKWVRYYLGYNSTDPIPIYDVIDANILISANRSCPYERRTLNTNNALGLVGYLNSRTRSINYAINYVFLNTLNPYINSSFFNDATNPITGVANQYDKIRIIQFTDIEETSDPATRAMYSAEDVEEWLDLMRVKWYVEETATQGYAIRFEHDEYFKRGLTYGTNSIGIDISDKKLQEKMVFSNKELPRLFELGMLYSSGDDFNGIPIMYGGGMANWNQGGVSSISSGSMATDINAALLGGDAGNDGFFLVATDGRDIISGNGAWSGVWIYNQPMSTANIEENLWIQRGVTAVGEMNGSAVEFDAVENNFTQSGVEVAWCGDFNPYKLVRTNYGDAIVGSATLTLNDKKFTLDLKYEE